MIDLLSLDKAQLKSLMLDLGQPAFRAKQVWEWLYERNAETIEQMTNLPKSLRTALDERTTIGSLRVAQEQVSSDGTIKRLYRLSDGKLIESVLMVYRDGRRTACISSQAGCAMGCVFCATGQMGFERQLSVVEIFEQVHRFSRELREKGERLSNVVLMGMGEPFHNYDSVLSAIRQVMSRTGIGARHITVSTVGLVPQIEAFADEGLQVGLAISLHESMDVRRSALLPINKKYPIERLIAACRYYVTQTNRRITFEWALIAGTNDSVQVALGLGRLLEGLHCHVNLIPLNPTTAYDGLPTDETAARSFVKALEGFGISATVRVRRGIDIDAGCGQLKSRETERLGAST